MDITRAVARISEQAERRFGVTVNVRVGVHRGVVYLDTDQDDVYGFAANLAARISSLAAPGTVAVSDAVATLIDGTFELAACPAAPVKGVDGPVNHHQVVSEYPQSAAPRTVPLVGRHRELAWLENTWRRARIGVSTCAGVAFRGEPGIGKTRLARAAAELVAESGGTVIELRGSPLHTDAGLYPVRRLLERRCGIDRLTGAAERLRLLDAELRIAWMDSATVIPSACAGAGRRTRARLPAFRGRRTHAVPVDRRRGSPIPFGVPEWQCGPHPRRGHALVRRLDLRTWSMPYSLHADGRLLVVVTGRDGKWLRPDWPVELFELTALSTDECNELIEALDPVVTEVQKTAVCSRCDGIPFYIEHVVAGLDAAGNDQVPEALCRAAFRPAAHPSGRRARGGSGGSHREKW